MHDIASLTHTRKQLSGGGQVVVLNTGAVITPESEAMLQALHSRSTDGIDGHLAILAEKGSEKFMSTYYVGYGHKSIGDCGSATLFIEGVSMLAAKAIQDWKLYSGQESSTRYIDFANQTFLNPAGTDAGAAIQETWRTFYLKAVAEMKTVLTERYPKAEEEKEAVYDKAIAARAFDTIRGFLPAGATTNLAWHGNLRQFADKTAQLLTRPHNFAITRLRKYVRLLTPLRQPSSQLFRTPSQINATKKLRPTIRPPWSTTTTTTQKVRPVPWHTMG